MNLNYKTMRRLVFALLMFLTLSLSAQNDGVIKFLGIPVDGTKEEMISKLKQKGFTFDKDEMFEGNFNGENIYGGIQTYNNKVYNIRFFYNTEGYNKSIIIHKFNSLVLNYDVNEKYLSNINLDKAMNDIDTYQIDTYEDIGYEMKKGKVYKAQYYYIFDKDLSDTTGYYQFKTETLRKYRTLADAYGKSIDEYINDSTLPMFYKMHRLEQDLVQFYIIDGMDYGKFNIMFDYYNRRNAPNGQDL